MIAVSDNMPQVFEVSDRIHIQRLGLRVAVVTPRTHSMAEVVAIMTGTADMPESAGLQQPSEAAPLS